MRYSESTGCFYPAWGKYDDLPADLIPVSRADFLVAINRPDGYSLVVANGRVTIAAAPLSPLAERQAIARDAIKGKEAQKNAKKIEHPQIAGVFFEPTGKIDKIIGRSDALANSDPLPTNGGCFDDVGENPIPMTVGQLKKLRNAIIDREEANYQNRKAHVSAMKAAPDPLTYDYSGGWA